VIRRLNLSAARMLGRERAALLGRSLGARLEKGQRGRLFAHLRAAFDCEGSVSDELLVRSAGEQPAREFRFDSRRHTRLSEEPCCLTTLIDVSGIRRLERELSASLGELRGLIAAAPIGIGIVQRWVLRSVSPRLLSMLGYDEAALLGRSARPLFADGAEFERIRAEIARQIAATGLAETETELRHQSGRSLDVLLRAAALDAGEPAGRLVLTVLDVTARKRIERELDEARLRLELALAGGDIGTYTCSLPHGPAQVDERYLAMLGYRPGELPLDSWRSWLAMIHPEDRPEFEARAQSLIDGELDSFEA
jgi:PAS domain S-box-containing protein